MECLAQIAQSSPVRTGLMCLDQGPNWELLYFPSINFHKAGGGFGPIRVNNREVIKVPFPKPEAEFDILIGDWYQKSY